VNTFANIINPNMKPEHDAWSALNRHAAAQLRSGFADRVLRAAHGPQPEAWRQLQARGADQLRPGFAERVLRAARAAADMPSLGSQFALSAATAALCLIAVIYFHQRSVTAADERNLAEWRQVVSVAEEFDSGML